MRIKNIFYIIFIIVSPYNTYGMKRPINIIYTGGTLPPLVDVYTPETLLREIQKHIATPDLIAVNSLLSTKTAAQLNPIQKKILYEQALETKKSIDLQIILTNIESEIISQSPESVSSSQKNLSLYLTQQKNLLTIINLLHLFQLLPTLKFPQALFTPQPYGPLENRSETLDRALKALIENEQEKIYVCCFHISLISVADSLIDTKKNNNVSIEVIIDQSQLPKYSNIEAIRKMIHNKILILAPQNDPYEQMHHKFFIFQKNIFNKSLVWTGSYNPTSNSNNRSWDDVLIIDNPIIIQKYIERFEEVKSKSK